MRCVFCGGVSSEWNPNRGLREGCPSSPTLFNIYHDTVMEDFRARRGKAAKRKGCNPGLEWHYKVDGRLFKRARLRSTEENKKGGTHMPEGKGFASEVRKTIIGDVMFADDTAILGREEETEVAETILLQTMSDWEQKLHPDKTEKLRISGKGREPYDVRRAGEANEVKKRRGVDVGKRFNENRYKQKGGERI